MTRMRLAKGNPYDVFDQKYPGCDRKRREKILGKTRSFPILVHEFPPMSDVLIISTYVELGRRKERFLQHMLCFDHHRFSDTKMNIKTLFKRGKVETKLWWEGATPSFVGILSPSSIDDETTLKKSFKANFPRIRKALKKLEARPLKPSKSLIEDILEHAWGGEFV